MFFYRIMTVFGKYYKLNNRIDPKIGYSDYEQGV